MSDLKISLRLTSRALLFLTRRVPRRGAPITRYRLLLTRFVLLARRPGTVRPRSNERLVQLLSVKVAFLAALTAVVCQMHTVLLSHIFFILLLEALRLVRTLSTFGPFS